MRTLRNFKLAVLIVWVGSCSQHDTSPGSKAEQALDAINYALSERFPVTVCGYSDRDWAKFEYNFNCREAFSVGEMRLLVVALVKAIADELNSCPAIVDVLQSGEVAPCDISISMHCYTSFDRRTADSVANASLFQGEIQYRRFPDSDLGRTFELVHSESWDDAVRITYEKSAV